MTHYLWKCIDLEHDLKLRFLLCISNIQGFQQTGHNNMFEVQKKWMHFCKLWWWPSFRYVKERERERKRQDERCGSSKDSTLERFVNYFRIVNIWDIFAVSISTQFRFISNETRTLTIYLKYECYIWISISLNCE